MMGDECEMPFYVKTAVVKSDTKSAAVFILKNPHQ